MLFGARGIFFVEILNFQGSVYLENGQKDKTKQIFMKSWVIREMINFYLILSEKACAGQPPLKICICPLPCCPS